MNKKQTMDENYINSKGRFMNRITTFFILVLLVIFPLVYDDYYFNILETKYRFYWLTMVLMFAALLITALIFLLFDWTDYGLSHTKGYFKDLFSKNWRKHFSAPDLAITAFWLTAVISTLISDFKYESFWGNEGRYNGLFLLTIYFVAYFCVTRFLKFKQIYVDMFLVVALLVCLWGISDYFGMDILGFRGRLQDRQRNMFTSSLGNVNTYVSFAGLALGTAMTLFAMEKKKLRMAFYYICTIISMMGLFMGLSDNAYLALGVLYGFMPFFLFKKRTGIKRYLILLATMLTVVKGITIINTIWAGKVIGLDSLFLILAEMKLLPVLIVVLWALVIGFYFYDYKKKLVTERCTPWFWRGWLIFVIAAAAAVLFMLWDANWGGHAQRYGALQRYLVLNDQWGTHRGYIWRIAMENYNRFSLGHKIFGYGPDTFAILTIMNNYKEMTSLYGEIFDSAHNEYIQYFVTIGPVGLLAYLTFLVSAAVRMFKKASDKPEVIAMFFGCAAYGMQALVNISVPIVAPIMWTMLMLGLAGCRGNGRMADQ